MRLWQQCSWQSAGHSSHRTLTSHHRSLWRRAASCSLLRCELPQEVLQHVQLRRLSGCSWSRLSGRRRHPCRSNRRDWRCDIRCRHWRRHWQRRRGRKRLGASLQARVCARGSCLCAHRVSRRRATRIARAAARTRRGSNAPVRNATAGGGGGGGGATNCGICGMYGSYATECASGAAGAGAYQGACGAEGSG